MALRPVPAIILLVALVLTFASPAHSQEIEQDKALHLTVSAVGTAGFIKIGQATNRRHDITLLNRFFSSSLMLGIGYAKEVQDQRLRGGGPIDQGDMRANGIGILTGNILQWEF